MGTLHRVPGDVETLREQYLAAIEHEIAQGRARLSHARHRIGEEAPPRVQALAAISDVTLEWLTAERDRLRSGGALDENEARRFLAQL
jgi:hypothetical protein